nr:osmotin-like protein TPM-1 [Ipomoea trifida]
MARGEDEYGAAQIANLMVAGGVHICQTGDCGGTMTCSEWGKPPNTIAEFGINQPNNTDFFDISLLEGFNIPMSLTPTNATTTDDKCHSISCTADIVAQCPAPLRDPGGCFSRLDVLTLIVTLRMMPPALSLALEEPLIIRLSSVHDQIIH